MNWQTDRCVDIWEFPRNPLFWGLLIGGVCAWRVMVNKGFVGIKVFMFCFSSLFIALAVWVGFFNGPQLIDWWFIALGAEAVPAVAYMMMVVERWIINSEKGLGVESDYDNVGEYQRGARLIKQEKNAKVFARLADEEISKYF